MNEKWLHLSQRKTTVNPVTMDITISVRGNLRLRTLQEWGRTAIVIPTMILYAQTTRTPNIALATIQAGGVQEEAIQLVAVALHG
jgi:hypothetical protein